jgi:hypothetical protein
VEEPPPRPLWQAATSSSPASRRAAIDSDVGSGINWKKVLIVGGGTLLIVGVAFWIVNAFFLKPSIYPTEGVVLYQGKPAVGALVTFHPEKPEPGKALPVGVVMQDGTFKLTTRKPGDGCPPGKYLVTVTRGNAEDAHLDPGMGRGSRGWSPPAKKKGKAGPLPAKYAKPETSGLNAEVKSRKGNRVEFKLD